MSRATASTKDLLKECDDLIAALKHSKAFLRDMDKLQREHSTLVESVEQLRNEQQGKAAEDGMEAVHDDDDATDTELDGAGVIDNKETMIEDPESVVEAAEAEQEEDETMVENEIETMVVENETLPADDDDDEESSASNIEIVDDDEAEAVAVKPRRSSRNTPIKKVTSKSGRRKRGLHKKYFSPKKWRRVNRSHRLQSFLQRGAKK